MIEIMCNNTIIEKYIYQYINNHYKKLNFKVNTT